MVKMLIADDESDIAYDLCSAVDWEREGIEVVGCATNGQEALEFIDQYLPDIALIDICMPILSGLDVVQQARHKGLQTQFIILSGYGEFEYAKRAIGLGVRDYLLKPSMPDEILNVVAAVKQNLKASGGNGALIEYYETHMQGSATEMREHFLAKLVKGFLQNRERILEGLRACGYTLSEKCMTVLLAKPANTCATDKLTELCADMYTCLAGHPQQKGPIYTEPMLLDACVLVVCCAESPMYQQNIVATANSLATNIKTHVYFALGGFVDQYEFLSKSYAESLALICQAEFFEATGRVLRQEDTFKNVPTYSTNLDEAILQELRHGNEEALSRNLELFYTELFDGSVDKNSQQHVSVLLVKSIVQDCIDRQMDTRLMLSKQICIFDSIMKAANVRELKSTVLEFLRDLLVMSFEGGRNLINIALWYIHENYSREISLETLSKQVFITPKYLSILFKQETGINYIDYLHNYRIEMSKKFLRDPQYKIYEISDQVGFCNPKYFSQIFKKCTHLTPKEYRDRYCSPPA